MAVTRYTLKQGETGPIIRVRPSVLEDGSVIDGNWTCRTSVNDKDGNQIIAPRAITTKTDDNLYFKLALSPTETESLSIATGADYTLYDQIVEIVNSVLSPKFNVEEDYELKIKPGGIPNV